MEQTSERTEASRMTVEPAVAAVRRAASPWLSRSQWRLLQQMVQPWVDRLHIPLILYFAICLLQPAGDPAQPRGALELALQQILGLVTGTLILGSAIRPGGLAERGIGWSATVCNGLHQTLQRILLVVLPLLAATFFFKAYAGGAYADSLGRLSLMSALFFLGMSMFSASNAIVRMESPVRGPRSDSRPTFWFAGGKLFRVLAAGIPLCLVFIAAIGYRFAAAEMGMRLLTSLNAVLFVLLGYGLCSRLLGLGLERARRLKLADRKASGDSLDAGADYRQVQQLARLATAVAVAWIVGRVWLDIVPLDHYLGQFEIWDNSNSGRPRVNYWDLFLAGSVVTVTALFSRNLPGLLELILPVRLPLDRGGRYAVTFVARYFVLLIGLVQAAGILGFAWEKVQWLAAGLTVGLGFGLQEIFANLISGIIILIERPVRVGDYVSVNNVTGTVTKMALRATTIQDSDRREWIVPNKKFITDDIMNWTLSDTISRAVFAIGVAYGSDTDRIRQTLLSVARANPQVLEFPEPDAVLSKFGATTLDFELRVYIPSRNVFTQVQNDLHMAIDKAFREARIEWAGWKNSPALKVGESKAA